MAVCNYLFALSRFLTPNYPIQGLKESHIKPCFHLARNASRSSCINNNPVCCSVVNDFPSNIEHDASYIPPWNTQSSSFFNPTLWSWLVLSSSDWQPWSSSPPLSCASPLQVLLFSPSLKTHTMPSRARPQHSRKLLPVMSSPSTPWTSSFKPLALRLFFRALFSLLLCPLYVVRDEPVPSFVF